jgi:hypothetical protein
MFTLAAAVATSAQAQTPAIDVPETHTVKEGDTLWDLSRQYFGDPVLWPRLYQMNTAVVEDPHWIYPGEVLRLKSDAAIESVPAASEPVAQAAPVDASQAPPTEAPPPADSSSRESAQVVEAPAEPVRTSSDTEPIFPRAGMVVSQPPLIRADFIDNYRAVTRAEFYQAGWLTEGKSWPYGTLIGTVAPTQVDARGSGAATLFSQVGVRPPAAGAYQVGDTLMSLIMDRGAAGGFGNIVIPTGLIRITDASRPEILGVVIAQYGPINPDDRVLMAEKYSEIRGVRAQPVADGTEGTLVAFRGNDVLRGVGDAVFIDKGREEGMKIGDVLEATRTLRPREPAAVVVPEVVARLQVTHLGDRTATARVIWVQYPDIPPGTKWKLVARLPG